MLQIPNFCQTPFLLTVSLTCWTVLHLDYFRDLKSRLCCNNNQQSSNLSCACVDPVSSLTPLLIFSGLHPRWQGARIHQAARKEREGMERDISRLAPSTLLHLHPCCDARYETWQQNQGQTTMAPLY